MSKEELPKRLLDKAYKNYTDSHTTYPLPTGNFSHDLPSVKPMEYGKGQFYAKCHEDKNFYYHWLNYKQSEHIIKVRNWTKINKNKDE